MPGRALEDKTKTQQQEISDKKQAFLAYFSRWPVKSAAADAINRSPDTIDIWLKDDHEFSEAFHRAKSEWALKKSSHIKPDNLLANMYAELKPPKQEIDAKVNVATQQTAEDLLKEARELGLDTSAYDHLIRPASDATPPD